jgi:hypothetical protein
MASCLATRHDSARAPPGGWTEDGGRGVDHYSGDDIRLMRQAHTGPGGRRLRQIDVARAMIPAVSRQWIDQLENRRRLSPERFRQVGAAILAAAR